MEGNPLSFKLVQEKREKTWDLIQTVMAGWHLHNCSSCVVFPVRCGQKPPKLLHEGNRGELVTASWAATAYQCTQKAEAGLCDLIIRRTIGGRRVSRSSLRLWQYFAGKLQPCYKAKKAYRCFERHTNYSPNTQFLQMSVQLSICWRILTDKSAPGTPHLEDFRYI